LTVADAALAHLLASHALLVQAWPGAYADAMALIQALRCAVPSLVVVLAAGLVEMLTPAPEEASPLITLRYRSAVMTALAGGQDGTAITEPHLRLEAVRRLAITNMSVGGRSGLRLAV
jgi:hypothetical protein